MKHLLVFVLLVVIILLSADSPLFSQDIEHDTETKEAITQEAAAKRHDTRKYGFVIAPFFGVVHGQSIELVYPTKTKGEYLSELLWDMKPVFYLGLNVDYRRKNIMDRLGVFVSASVKIGIPGDTGIMEDRDWQSTENNALTNFSSHTNKTNGFYCADVLVGMSVPLKYLYITPFLSGSWMHFSFEGRDGYRDYENFEPKVGVFSGKVIEYKQNWFIISPGFTIGTDILSPFSIDLSFQITPLTFCNAVDQHLVTGVTYYDYVNFGLFLEPRGSVSLKTNMFDFTFEFAYRCVISSQGETYYQNKNSEHAFLSPNDPGAGFSLFDVRFLARIRLYGKK